MRKIYTDHVKRGSEIRLQRDNTLALEDGKDNIYI